MINVVIESVNSHPIEVLEQNAIKLILQALEEFEPDYHQVSLLYDIRQTLSGQLE